MATAVVGGILATAVGFIIRGLIRNRKAGKTSCSCGGDCAHCRSCR